MVWKSATLILGVVYSSFNDGKLGKIAPPLVNMTCLLGQVGQVNGYGQWGYGGGLIHKSMQITTPHMLEFNQIGDELGPNTFMQWVGVVFHTCSCIYPTLNKSSWGLVPTHNNVYWHPLWGLHGGCNLHTFVYLAPNWGWLSEVIHAHNLPHSAMQLSIQYDASSLTQFVHNCQNSYMA